MRKIFLILCCLPLISFAQGKKITLDDIWKKGTFSAERVRGFRSMQDGEHYVALEKGVLVKKSFKTGEKVDSYDFYNQLEYEGKKLRIASFQFNKTENKMLLFTEAKQIYRRSYAYKVFVYDIANEKLQLVSPNKILHAAFSPQSDKVAFVKGNNLYFMDLNTNETKQITQDGDKNIINGNCDWVYEEEFGFTKAYAWSPDGNYLAYYRFDQTQVPEFTMMYFKKLYPNKYEFKYPKAGDPNSSIKIGVFDIQKGNNEFVSFEEEYIPRIKWTNYNQRLIIYTLNRHQNNLRFYALNPKTMRDKLVYEEKNKYYIDVNDEITFLKNEDAFVHTSEKSGFNHIYYHSMRNRTSRQLTDGKWDVVSLLGVDESSDGLYYEDRRRVYYTAAQKSPLERNLFSIDMFGGQKESLTPKRGWHAISFSKQFKYFVDNYSTLKKPANISLKDKYGKLVRVLKNNKRLESKMKDYKLGDISFIKVPLENGTNLNAWMLRPYDFNPNKKYPLIMYQYSGPGSQSVANRFGTRDFWWYQMLAQQGYIIACVDGRGTGFRGEEFKKMTYQQLGKYESDDQIAAGKHFGQLPYIDAKRIGIWGWSYGGFMSSICITKGADVFKSAIAVAPVTSWRYYDNIYTERYMRTPQENPNGYDDNSPINMVDKLKGNYLLIHGSGDDNVHYQNTMEMINAMIKADVDYDTEIYPNRNHGIYGGNTRYHLYRRMTNFWLEKL